MKRLVALLLLLVTALATARAQRAPDDLKPTVILISLDGWRWDYARRYGAPNLERLIARGVRAEHLIPSFPSKTFPNHYTIVTGLYPGHHGIVANTIKDPTTGRWFSMSDRKEVVDPMWWGGEPIWVGLQRSGRNAAAMFWPGSEAPIQGTVAALLADVRYQTGRQRARRSGAAVARSAGVGAADLPDALHQRGRHGRPRQRSRLV